jgi:hypothetical protein
MFGHRRPWVTSLLALALGLVGFGLLFTTEATDDYCGWTVVVCALQLLWLWTVDLRGGDEDQASRRMSLASRISSTILIGLAGGVISAGPLYAVLDMAMNTGVSSDWDSILGLVVLVAPLNLALVWGVAAWLVSKRRTPRVAVRSLLAPLTAVSLFAAGLAYVAYRMTEHSRVFLVGLLSLVALVGALAVLAWTAIPWLELLLSQRGRDRSAGAKVPTARLLQ